MANFDDDINEADDDAAPGSKINKKKILLILIPALAVIAIIVGFYYTLKQRSKVVESLNYSIVHHTDDSGKATEAVTVFYDLPEVEVLLQNAKSQDQVLKVKISIELSKIEDINTIEALSSKLTDAVIAHIIELTPEEISGSEGLYWLREELLYRMNLIAAPVEISNLNFKIFEVRKRQ